MSMNFRWKRQGASSSTELFKMSPEATPYKTQPHEVKPQKVQLSDVSKSFRPLLITASLANVIDHLETSLYLFLAPVIIRDLLGVAMDEGLITWSLGLTLGGLLRIALALAWNRVHQFWGSGKMLSVSLFAVSLASLGLGGLGLFAPHLQQLLGLALPLLFMLLRAVQSVFSMAESHASRTLLMSCPAHQRTLASTLANASGISGTFLAALLCLLISQVDPQLRSWPWIYLTWSILAMSLATWRMRYPLPVATPSRCEKLNLPSLVICTVAATFGYATYHWVTILTATPAIGSQMAYLTQQTLILGVDIALLLFMSLTTYLLGTRLPTLLSAWICSALALLYGLELIDQSLARWSLLAAGVASAACYSSWLSQVVQARQLFPYSCLGGALGSALASLALNASLYARSEEWSHFKSTVPFMIIFLLQAMIVSLWLYSCLNRAPSHVNSTPPA